MQLITSMVSILLLLFSVATMAAEQLKYRLILQVSEDSVDRLNTALDNARHTLKAFGPENVQIQIVVFGSGVQTSNITRPFPLPIRSRRSPRRVCVSSLVKMRCAKPN